MTVTATPPLKLSNLVTEFGSDGTPSLKDYVRGGARVPDIAANAAVANTTGALKLSQFYGTQAGDVTPNAIAWADVIGTLTIATSSTQTLSGITVPIMIRVNHDGDVDITFTRSVNGGLRTAMVTGDTFTMNNGDTLNFRSANSSGSSNFCSATIINVSDGNTTLDIINFIHP